MATHGFLLPRELIDIVVTFLDGDGPSLRVCSLVAKSWSVVSRAHIFRSTSAETTEAISSLSSLVDASPSIGPLIRKLVLGHCPANCAYNPFSTSSLETLISLISHLPNLRTLRLMFLEFSGGTTDHTHTPGTYPVPLDTLELIYLKPRDMQQLFDILQLFTPSRTLRVENAFVMPYAGSPEDSLAQADTWEADELVPWVPPPYHTRSLHIRFSRYGIDRFMHSFANAPSKFINIDGVESLDMELPLGLNDGLAADLVQTFGPRLSEYTLDLKKLTLAKEVNTDFLHSMKYFRELRSFTLFITLDSDKPHFCLRTWDYIITLLESLDDCIHSTLCHFKLVWDFIGVDTSRPLLSRTGWQRFEGLLLAFGSLEKVEFCWGPSRVEAEVPKEPVALSVGSLLGDKGRATVEEMVPRLYSKELLVFSEVAGSL